MIMKFIILISIFAALCQSFSIIQNTRRIKLSLSSDSNGNSPLPTFDNIINPTVNTATESPVADRTMDSALDFLVETENATEEDNDEYDFYQIYEDSPDIEIPYDLISKLETEEMNALINKPVKQSVINKQSLDKIGEVYKKHPTDVGSAEFQIARLNERVKYLTTHLLKNKHDVKAKKGLNTIVTKRRKLLNYLYETNRESAEKLISDLQIRFKAPGRLWDKEAKYGAFKNTKSKWLKIRAEEKAEKKLREQSLVKN